MLLEKSHSVGSASRVSQVGYLDPNAMQAAHLGGSGSLLFGEGPDYLAGHEGAYHPQRPGDFAGPPVDPAYGSGTHQDQRAYGSDVSLLKINQELNSAEKDLMVKQAEGFGGKRGHRNWQAHSQQIDSVSTPFKQEGPYGELRDPSDPGDLDMQYRNYDTPDAMIQKSHADARGLAEDIMDMEMGLKRRKAFTREDFRLMINQTYTEYYGKFRD